MNTHQLFSVRPPRTVHWRLPDGSPAGAEFGEGSTSTSRSNGEHELPTPHDRKLVNNARNCLNDHNHFRGRCNTIQIECNGNRLVVSGQLPTFYLKQLLQSALMQVEGVTSVENHVAVINSEGLSSATGPQKQDCQSN